MKRSRKPISHSGLLPLLEDTFMRHPWLRCHKITRSFLDLEAHNPPVLYQDGDRNWLIIPQQSLVSNLQIPTFPPHNPWKDSDALYESLVLPQSTIKALNLGLVSPPRSRDPAIFSTSCEGSASLAKGFTRIPSTANLSLTSWQGFMRSAGHRSVGKI